MFDVSNYPRSYIQHRIEFMLLKDLTWPEVKSLDFNKLVVLFPTGSFEQHGPHLPFTTDTDIVSAIAERLEQVMPDHVLLLPTLWPGLSTHHMHFPGTMDVPQMLYIQLITELGKSMASMGAKKVFILNGHGGNDTPLRAALRELKTAVPQTQVRLRFLLDACGQNAPRTCANRRRAAWATPARWKHPSCSICIQIACISIARCVTARRIPIPIARPICNSAGRYSSSMSFMKSRKSGVIGHPDLASAEKGKRFLDGIVARRFGICRTFSDVGMKTSH